MVEVVPANRKEAPSPSSFILQNPFDPHCTTTGSHEPIHGRQQKIQVQPGRPARVGRQHLVRPDGDLLRALQVPEFPCAHRSQGIGDSLPQALVGIDGKPPQILGGVLGIAMPAGIKVVLELPDEFLFFGVQVVEAWRDRGGAHDHRATLFPDCSANNTSFMCLASYTCCLILEIEC